MEMIGLMPSDTGKEGGKKTGKSMADYAIEGGLFLEVVATIPKEFIYPLVCISESAKVKEGKKAKNKIKYSCPSCEANIWGKAGLTVTCDDCDEHFVRTDL